MSHVKQNRAEQNGTEQNRTEQNRTEQNKTEQNRTEQNKTKQNKTKQNKTKQNKTKQKVCSVAFNSARNDRRKVGIWESGKSTKVQLVGVLIRITVIFVKTKLWS